MPAPEPHVPTEIRWYRHADRPGSTSPTLLWLHGGGFFSGGLDMPEADDFAQALADAGLTVATAAYRLAPTPGPSWLGFRRSTRPNIFPAAFDDVMIAYRAVAAESPGGVILGGASAGACLAAGAVLRGMDGGQHPVGAVFAYGFFHARHTRMTDRRHRSPGIHRLGHTTLNLNAMNRSYAGTASSLSHRYAFPGGHDLRGFPQTLLIHAERDSMRASAVRFGVELAAAGTAVRSHEIPGTAHAFLNRPHTEAFSRAITQIADWAAGLDAQRPV